jgi:hypothetical protein
VLSWNGGLHFTSPTSPQHGNLEAQSPFRGQQITHASALEELLGAPAYEGMMSAARNCPSTDPQILNIIETDTIEGMGIVPSLES